MSRHVSGTIPDCVIVGAGPVGLTAATYLARFRRSVRIFNSGESRAALIPIAHNFPGFPDGISGADFLQRLRKQAANYGVQAEEGRVAAISAAGDDLFSLIVNDQVISARTVILATGVEDKKPDIPGWHEGTLAGVIRWCPICDGYEATDRAVAVWSNTQQGLAHCRFLRTYTRDITLVLGSDGPGLDAQQRRELAHDGIALIEEPLVRVISVGRRAVVIETGGGRKRSFDYLYPLVGSEPRTSLLDQLKPKTDANRSITVDEHQRTSVTGLYAAGDVVRAPNQMTVGAGHATAAATSVHQLLAANFR